MGHWFSIKNLTKQRKASPYGRHEVSPYGNQQTSVGFFPNLCLNRVEKLAGVSIPTS